MTDPWNIEDPFEPMFNEVVSVRVNPRTGAESEYAACVFPFDDIEPMSDLDVESKKQLVKVLFKKSACPQNLQIGGVIVLKDKSKWDVIDVSLCQSWLEVTGRSTV